ncbi:protein STICHEL [Salix suchowensis]|nr:protein STICHEL [Salix suchowensis]
MADGRRHSVDIPITRTLIALRRVRSLRDPSTNSMSKFSSLLENFNWETSPTKDISLQSASGSKEGGSNHNRLSGWKNLGHDGQSKQQVDNFDSGSEFEKSKLIFCDSFGGVKNMDALFRTKKVEGLDCCMEKINGTKSLSEAYYGSHRNKELNLVCITPSSNHLEDVDSTNGPIAGSPLGESTDQSVTRRKSRYKNQVQSYGGVGDILSRVGSPCFSVSDALSSQGTSLFANEEADFMVQKDHGCGIRCCWTRTSRPRDSNPSSDAEGSPLLLAETSPCGKRSWKNAANETPRSLSHKFRPKSFDELVGQGVVVRSLLGAISRGRITSLYLFHGPRGTGKTSASKIFAAALNCLSHEDCKPCGLCRECYMFFSGRSRDVKEVDSVRINRTGRIRSLIRDASMPPISSRFKVFIVDECHLLHGETWAIVLNSLENLSENVVFVMVTPELDMLPKSAVTRSHKYHFPKVKEADIAVRLRNICVEEALDFDQVALDFIAAKSSGSLRDAEIMLDQLSLLGKRITMTMVHELIGVVSDDELLGLLDLALSSDTSSTVIRARELMRSRIDPMQLVSQLANLIMDVLAGKCKNDSSEARRKFSRKHSSEGDMQRLSHALKILSESEKQLRMSRNQSTWLTAALLQLSSLEASALDVNDSKSSIRDGLERDGNFSSTPSTGESLKHLALYSCEDSKLQKSQVQGDCQATLDTIWKRAGELCQSNSLRNFLRKQGKLSSLHINRGLAVAELEFHHSDYASKAEKSWKHIASLLQTILGCNVEIRINLVLCAPPASKCAKLWKQSFCFFSCSRRMRRKSQPPMERGIDSDNSDNNSERPMIRERAISACPSGCRSQISHNCYHGVEVARALRNSEGNVLSIGTTSSLGSLHDDKSKTPGHGFSSSMAGGNELDYTIFYNQEAEDQPSCFPKSPRLQKMSRSSVNTQVVCAGNH